MAVPQPPQTAQKSRFKVRVGDLVVFFRASKPQIGAQPSPGIVSEAGLNGYCSIHTFNRTTEVGGGRPTSNYSGCVPGDIDPTPAQIQNSGCWIPLSVWHWWCELRESEPKADYPLKKLWQMYDEQVAPRSQKKADQPPPPPPPPPK